jgi:hypothetical protein
MVGLMEIVAGIAIFLSVTTVLMLLGVGLLILGASDDVGRRY